jgi:hypothetical protein
MRNNNTAQATNAMTSREAPGRRGDKSLTTDEDAVVATVMVTGDAAAPACTIPGVKPH